MYTKESAQERVIPLVDKQVRSRITRSTRLWRGPAQLLSTISAALPSAAYPGPRRQYWNRLPRVISPSARRSQITLETTKDRISVAPRFPASPQHHPWASYVEVRTTRPVFHGPFQRLARSYFYCSQLSQTPLLSLDFIRTSPSRHSRRRCLKPLLLLPCHLQSRCILSFRVCLLLLREIWMDM